MHRDKPYRKRPKHPRKPPYTSKEYQQFRQYLSRKYLSSLMAEHLINESKRLGFARRILNPEIKQPPPDTRVQDAFHAELVPYNHRLRYAHLIPTDFNDRLLGMVRAPEGEDHG